jgi:hypothetical protein
MMASRWPPKMLPVGSSPLSIPTSSVDVDYSGKGVTVCRSIDSDLIGYMRIPIAIRSPNIDLEIWRLFGRSSCQVIFEIGDADEVVP